jgi:hypothetical protein
MQAAALEHASRKTSSSLDAYDYLLRGKYCHHLETPDANREAEAHFDRAIELDPRFASAPMRGGAIQWIERAMRLDPFSAHRYYLDMVRALFMAECPTEASRPRAGGSRPDLICRLRGISMVDLPGNGAKTRPGCATRWRELGCPP